MTGAERALERGRRKIKRKEQMVEGLNFKRGWDQEHVEKLKLTSGKE